MEVPELVKADQVLDRSRELIAFRAHESREFAMTDGELHLVGDFLLRHHYPRGNNSHTVRETPPPSEPPPIPETPTSPETALGRCSKCRMQSIIKWGRYGYHWHCVHCENNMPIKEHCPTCKMKMKLRKARNDFYKRCEECGIEEHYCQFVASTGSEAR